MPFDTMFLRPYQNGAASQLGAVVADDAIRFAITLDQNIKLANHAVTSDRRINCQRQAFPATLIHDAQNTEPPPIR